MVRFFITLVIIFHVTISHIMAQTEIKSVEIIYGKRLDIKNLKSDVKPEIKKARTKVNKMISDLNYILRCNGNESIFYYEESLVSDANKGMRRLITKGGADGTFYNSKNQKLLQLEFSGESFLIDLSKDKITWKITNETKKISGYTCYKATANVVYENKVINKKTNLKYIAWFTKEIPFQYGPIGLNGLPGLILEATKNGSMIFYAREIRLNKKVKIKKPSKGIRISHDDFEKIIEEKLQGLFGKK